MSVPPHTHTPTRPHTYPHRRLLASCLARLGRFPRRRQHRSILALLTGQPSCMLIGLWSTIARLTISLLVMEYSSTMRALVEVHTHTSTHALSTHTPHTHTLSTLTHTPHTHSPPSHTHTSTLTYSTHTQGRPL